MCETLSFLNLTKVKGESQKREKKNCKGKKSKSEVAGLGWKELQGAG